MNSGEDIAPVRVADTMLRRLAAADVEISAYWMRIVGDRDAYAASLQRELADHPVLVCVVRDQSFNNPNAVAADVMKIIEAHKTNAQAVLLRNSRELHCGVVLLGRAALTVAQASSPVTVPDWFEVRAGETVNIVIEESPGQSMLRSTARRRRLGRSASDCMSWRAPS